MNPVFIRTYSQATEEEVQAFEKLVGYKLPGDYRNFLLTQNGGEGPTPQSFKVATGETTLLQRLYPLGCDKDDLIANFNWKEGEFPKEVILIGQDLGGNFVCLALDGKKKGHVLFLDHETNTESPEDIWDNLFLIAPSFDEFLKGLYD